MASVGIRELKHETSAIVRRVRERGESVDVTYHGRIVARLVPVASEDASVRRSRAAWRDVDALAQEIGARWPRGMTAAKAMRGARRG
jgi:prevent-host-death family protein